MRSIPLKWIAVAGALFALGLGYLYYQNSNLSELTTADRRPDIIKRSIPIQLANTNIPQTIYEYVDIGSDITTGRSWTFLFPGTFSYRASIGPSASAIGIRLDMKTGRAWQEMPAEFRNPNTDTIRREAYRRAVGATLHASYFASRFEQNASEQQSEVDHVIPAKYLFEAKQRGIVDIADIKSLRTPGYGTYHWLGKRYCGFEMFEKEKRGNPLARAAQIYPFSHASIFAKPDGNGGYKQIVRCNQRTKYGACRYSKIAVEYFSSLVIGFGGENLCRVDDVFKFVVEKFKEYQISETDRIPGWGKPIGAYAE